MARRTGGDKTPLPLDDGFAAAVAAELQGVHDTLWEEGESNMCSQMSWVMLSSFMNDEFAGRDLL